ncbi:hypothetical protein HNQ59_002456 [Chitinivorax tropicus]|uniref:Uncharacterized protein n=1 Tax=Chitinivorax tropicus TaxID=714531 RepID=A0A840MKH6_9PROT|nr:hypothetical protein [Chitinivorax tropicus]
MRGLSLTDLEVVGWVSDDTVHATVVGVGFGLLVWCSSLWYGTLA